MIAKILVVEDDAGLNRGIVFALSQEGYAVLSARTIREGEQLFKMETPDAVLLDLNLPDGDGNFVEENTFSVNISRLRKKIGGDHIRTIHGMGYLWEEA